MNTVNDVYWESMRKRKNPTLIALTGYIESFLDTTNRLATNWYEQDRRRLCCFSFNQCEISFVRICVCVVRCAHASRCILDKNRTRERARERANDWKGQPSSLLSSLREWMRERMRCGAGPHYSTLLHDSNDVCRNEKKKRGKNCVCSCSSKVERWAEVNVGNQKNYPLISSWATFNLILFLVKWTQSELRQTVPKTTCTLTVAKITVKKNRTPYNILIKILDRLVIYNLFRFYTHLDNHSEIL